MLIESLIRLGKPFVEGGLPPAQILDQVSDIEDPSVRNFLSHVVIVEYDRSRPAVAVEWVRWVQMRTETSGKKKKENVYPDVERARTAPFVVPVGGNPLHAQGRYGIPAYLFYEKHVELFKTNFAEVVSFLASRLEKTGSLNLPPETVEDLAGPIHDFFRQTSFPEKEKAIGLLVLAIVGDEGVYRYEPAGYVPRPGWEGILTNSFLYPDRVIVADLQRIAALFWESKIAEGEEKGRLEGDEAICSFCGSVGETVSAYSKAWNWFTTTWTGPLSSALKQDQLVEGIGLCPNCYRALTYGSRVFDRLTVPLPLWLAKEIFAPAGSPRGAKQQRSRNASDVPTVYGGVLVLPVLDEWLEDGDSRADFVRKMSTMMNPHREGQSSRDLHLKTITGLEMWLPDLDETQEYRLTILYYSGDPSRADIHLRAVIEDVIPSTARAVKRMIEDVYEESEALRERLFGPEGMERFQEFYLSLPALLAKAYGSGHIWATLAKVLHRRPLSRRQFLRLVNHRLQELTSQYTQKLYDIRQEVLFYLMFRDFLRRYHGEFGGKGEDEDVRSWQDMLDVLAKRADDPPAWADVEELGFAAGYLLREFGKSYRAKTGKDYLESRVITFGNQLTPDVILKYGLINLKTHAARHRIRVWSLEKLLGSILAGFLELKEPLRRDPDAFLAAFWAGYCLNRPASKETEAAGQQLPVDPE